MPRRKGRSTRRRQGRSKTAPRSVPAKRRDASGPRQAISNAEQYPLDVLRLIFTATSPNPDEIDTSDADLLPRPYNQAMQNKRAVALVCRSWHHAAASFVYDDVVFHRPRQVAALARALKDDPALGGLIPQIQLLCHASAPRSC
ncbi:hypothetical protein K474DRAFT_1710665 [Panus rudis PR-1116 ss-1]|nr:hypothetical protein K474DRAFT_1710665 [Panus rudis PR-1116 ss-1]